MREGRVKKAKELYKETLAGAMERPTIITCGQCGDDLHIIPIKRKLSNGTVEILTMNMCGNCTFKKPSN